MRNTFKIFNLLAWYMHMLKIIVSWSNWIVLNVFAYDMKHEFFMRLQCMSYLVEHHTGCTACRFLIAMEELPINYYRYVCTVLKAHCIEWWPFQWMVCNYHQITSTRLHVWYQSNLTRIPLNPILGSHSSQNKFLWS